MKNLNPIYLLEVKTDTILKSAKKVRNALVKGGMSEKKATKKIVDRLHSLNSKKGEKLRATCRLNKRHRFTPQYNMKTNNIWNTIRAERKLKGLSD